MTCRMLGRIGTVSKLQYAAVKKYLDNPNHCPYYYSDDIVASPLGVPRLPRDMGGRVALVSLIELEEVEK
jgi:hypothetical protein